MPLSGRGPALIFANNNVYGHSEFGLDLREKARGLFVNNELTMNTINICVQASRPLSPLRPIGASQQPHLPCFPQASEHPMATWPKWLSLASF